MAARFALTDRDLEHLAFTTAALPIEEVTATQPSALGGWMALADFAALRDVLPGEPDHDVVDVLTGEASAAALVQATGWDEADVSSLVGSGGLAFAEPDFHDVEKLLRLASGVTLARQTGVAAATLLAWTAAWPDAAQAREIVDAVRARQARHDAWLATASNVNDPLRERQRDALVAFLVPRLAFDSPNDLFGHFLLDVEMSACMATSRIVQASASVQLFVQRCLLGLEPDVSPKAIDADAWQWRKTYRVWEANRKVFLYPENWIEPDLRLDKSPFFRELETDIQKGELTDDNLERAVKSYLDKLVDVGRLDVVSMYWQDEVDVLHVFARTVSPPYQYY
ncbi:MAG: neuraminidase-like domain-containing protein, partial [Candidatus Rokuibacteriota bacterium]